MVEVVEETGDEALGLYPIPANESIRLRLNNNYEGPVDVQITGSAGNVLLNDAGYKARGATDEKEIRLDGLKRGLYLIQLRADQRYVRKFLKERKEDRFHNQNLRVGRPRSRGVPFS